MKKGTISIFPGGYHISKYNPLLLTVKKLINSIPFYHYLIKFGKGTAKALTACTILTDSLTFATWINGWNLWPIVSHQITGPIGVAAPENHKYRTRDRVHAVLCSLRRMERSRRFPWVITITPSQARSREEARRRWIAPSALLIDSTDFRLNRLNYFIMSLIVQIIQNLWILIHFY